MGVFLLSVLLIAIAYYIFTRLRRSRYLFRTTLLDPQSWFQLMKSQSNKNKEIIAEATLLQMGNQLVKMGAIPSIDILQQSILKPNISFSNYLLAISKTNVPKSYADDNYKFFDDLIERDQIRTIFAVIVMSLIHEHQDTRYVFSLFEKNATFPIIQEW